MKTMLKKMVLVSCLGRVSEYFLSHYSQCFHSINVKLKVVIWENDPCHLSNYLSINAIEGGSTKPVDHERQENFNLGLTSTHRRLKHQDKPSIPHLLLA